MPTILDCPNCGRKLRVGGGAPGTAFQCPTCGTTFDAPTGAPSSRRCPYCREDVAAAAVWCQYCHEDLHADRPPWERPNEERRDKEPHRGSLVLALGVSGLVAAVLGPAALIGVPVSVLAWVLGQLDLRRMERGDMDPRGRDSTTSGMACGRIGTLIGGLWLLCLGLMLYSLIAEL